MRKVLMCSRVVGNLFQISPNPISLVTEERIAELTFVIVFWLGRRKKVGGSN